MSFTKTKFNLIIFEFEYLNIHISHLAQLEMIEITLKCQKKNIHTKFDSFGHYLTWFLAPKCVFAIECILIFSYEN
jgi:hypothetical protein